MVVKFEVQARKKPKLNRYMDILDFQFILLLGLLIPFVFWYLFGIHLRWTIWPFVIYIIWMFKFKVDKPPGYWNHWLSFQVRGKRFSALDTSPLTRPNLTNKAS